MKGLVTGNKHVQYESPTSSGLKVIAKVKVFVYAASADARAMTTAPRLAKKTNSCPRSKFKSRKHDALGNGRQEENIQVINGTGPSVQRSMRFLST